MNEDVKEWQVPFTPAAVHNEAPRWTLSSDARLLLLMKGIQTDVTSRMDKLDAELAHLSTSSIQLQVGLMNAYDDFSHLANDQFVENRVYEREVVTEKPSKTKVGPPSAALHASIKQSIHLGLAAFKRPRVASLSRLPPLVSSAEFHSTSADELCGSVAVSGATADPVLEERETHDTKLPISQEVESVATPAVVSAPPEAPAEVQTEKSAVLSQLLQKRGKVAAHDEEVVTPVPTPPLIASPTPVTRKLPQQPSRPANSLFDTDSEDEAPPSAAPAGTLTAAIVTTAVPAPDSHSEVESEEEMSRRSSKVQVHMFGADVASEIASRFSRTRSPSDSGSADTLAESIGQREVATPKSNAVPPNPAKVAAVPQRKVKSLFDDSSSEEDMGKPQEVGKTNNAATVKDIKVNTTKQVTGQTGSFDTSNESPAKAVIPPAMTVVPPTKTVIPPAKASLFDDSDSDTDFFKKPAVSKAPVKAAAVKKVEPAKQPKTSTLFDDSDSDDFLASSRAKTTKPPAKTTPNTAPSNTQDAKLLNGVTQKSIGENLAKKTLPEASKLGKPSALFDDSDSDAAPSTTSDIAKSNGSIRGVTLAVATSKDSNNAKKKASLFNDSDEAPSVQSIPTKSSSAVPGKDSLFASLKVEKPNSLFADSDSDKASSNHSTRDKLPSAKALSKVVTSAGKGSSKASSLFDDSDSDDFVTQKSRVPPLRRKEDVTRPIAKVDSKASSLFDESDSDGDLFAKRPKPGASSTKPGVKPTAQTQQLDATKKPATNLPTTVQKPDKSDAGRLGDSSLVSSTQQPNAAISISAANSISSSATNHVMSKSGGIDSSASSHGKLATGVKTVSESSSDEDLFSSSKKKPIPALITTQTNSSANTIVPSVVEQNKRNVDDSRRAPSLPSSDDDLFATSKKPVTRTEGTNIKHGPSNSKSVSSPSHKPMTVANALPLVNNATTVKPPLSDSDDDLFAPKSETSVSTRATGNAKPSSAMKSDFKTNLASMLGSPRPPGVKSPTAVSPGVTPPLAVTLGVKSPTPVVQQLVSNRRAVGPSRRRPSQFSALLSDDATHTDSQPAVVGTKQVSDPLSVNPLPPAVGEAKRVVDPLSVGSPPSAAAVPVTKPAVLQTIAAADSDEDIFGD